MATRLYFNASRNAAINIGAAVGSLWDQDIGSGAIWPTKRAQTATDGNSNTNHLTTNLGNTNPWDILFGQFLTDELPLGVTISGTVSGNINCREGHASDNMYTQLGLYVVDSSGVLVATLLNGANSGGLELNSPSATNRNIPRDGSTAISSYTTVDATSRVCIEIGLRAEANRNTCRGYMYYGGGNGTDLAPGDGNESSTIKSPWLEFSADIFTPPAGGGARAQAAAVYGS